MKSSIYSLSLLSLLVATPVMAAESVEQEAAKAAYSSPEIEVAVEAARRFPVQNEYVGYEWYNRTTSKSFPLPKMLNAEMNSLIVEGALGPTAAGAASAEDATRPVRRVALGQNDEDEDVIDTEDGVDTSERTKYKAPREFIVNESRAQVQTGEMITRQVRGVGTVTATVRN